MRTVAIVALLLFGSFAIAGEAIPHSFSCLQSVESLSDLTGPVWNVQELKDGRVLLEAKNGWFLLGANATMPQLVGAKDLTGPVRTIRELKDGRVLVGAQNGLFLLGANATTPQLVGAKDLTGSVRTIHELKDGRVLMETEKGLFLLGANATTPQPVGAENLTGPIRTIHELDDGRVLLEAKNGWFLLGANATVPQPVRTADITGSVRTIRELKDRRVLVGAENGLFLLGANATTLQLVEVGDFYDPFDVDIQELKDGRVLVVTRKGWFLLGANATTLQLVGAENLTCPSRNQKPYIRELENGRVLVGTEKGDWFLLGTNATMLQLIEAEDVTDDPSWRNQELRIQGLKDGRVLMQTQKGWFLLGANAMTPQLVGAKDLTGFVWTIQELKDGRVLVKTGKGWFLLGAFSQARVSFAKLPTVLAVRQATTIDVEVSANLCADSIKLWNPQLRVSRAGVSPEGLALKDPIRIDGHKAIFSYEFAAFGPYTLQFLLGGAPFGDAEEVIAGDLRDLILLGATLTSVGLIILHFFIVSALVIMARWSLPCLRIVLDPDWSKAGIYLNFLLRHWRFIQLWLLDRYFQEARTKLRAAKQEPYEPLPLTTENGSMRWADVGILDLLKQRNHLWIHGRAGMGKTVLVRMLERAYFALDNDEAPMSSRSAYRRWGQVLVFVSARRYEALPADADRPERWLVKVVSRRIASFLGLDFDDEKMVAALMRCGTLGVVIDGVNEVGKEDQVAAFALVSPRTAVLATAQTEAKEPFLTLRLPANVQEHVGRLVRAHMGEVEGERLETRLQSECPGLVNSLLSGYDIRLIIDIAQQPLNRLPSTRSGLYQTILDALGPEYPLVELAALAWKMWLTGQRELPHGKGTDERVIQPLERENRKIIRRLSREVAEFRHDQMRAYLAAYWLVEQAANAEAMLIHLKDDQVWRVPARDQDEVWPFVAALLPSELLSPIWTFTLSAQERVRLQHAIQDEADRRGMPLVRT